MKNLSKLAILQSLDVMDQMQMENVLVYIRQLLQHENMASKNFKKEAMKEIRKALRQYKQPASMQQSA
jgi:ubiquitin-protein ligase